LQVAALIWRGIKAGRFVVPNPDFVQSMLVATQATAYPRSLLYRLWEAAVGLVKTWIFLFVAADWDSVTRSHAQTRYAALWAGSSSGGGSGKGS
jgi:hypothetical protein